MDSISSGPACAHHGTELPPPIRPLVLRWSANNHVQDQSPSEARREASGGASLREQQERDCGDLELQINILSEVENESWRRLRGLPSARGPSPCDMKIARLERAWPPGGTIERLDAVVPARSDLGNQSMNSALTNLSQMPGHSFFNGGRVRCVPE